MRSALVMNAQLLGRPASVLRGSRPGRLIATCHMNGSSKDCAAGSMGKSKLSALLAGWSSLTKSSHSASSQRKFSGRSSRGIGAGGGGTVGGGGGGGGGGGSSGGSPWGLYMRWLESNPILTKSLTAAVLNAIGDILSQTKFEKVPKLDLKRVLQFGFLGLVMVGPALHFWYGALATNITIKGVPGLLTRLACDQVVFAPIFIGTFFSALLLLEGHPELISNKLKQDLKGALYANWQLWIPVQFLNFAFVPVSLQVLFSNTIAIGWNTFMSYKAHKQVPPAEVEL